MTPLETVRAYYRLFERPDQEVCDAIVTDDFRADDDPMALHLRSKEHLWRTVSRMQERGSLVPEGTFSVEEYLGDERRGAARWRWQASGAMAPFFGLAASDKAVEIQGLALVDFRDGKLASLTEFWDSAELFRHLGADIPGAGRAAPAS